MNLFYYAFSLSWGEKCSDKVDDHHRMQLGVSDATMRERIQHEMVGSRIQALQALRSGFIECISALSPRLNGLSRSDLWLLFHGRGWDIAPQDVLTDLVNYEGFSEDNVTRRSFEELIKQWMREPRQTKLRGLLECSVGCPCLKAPGLWVADRVLVRKAIGRGVDDLPEFHVDVGRIDLPDYGSFEILRARLESALLDLGEL
jgi:hypothetical protein